MIDSVRGEVLERGDGHVVVAVGGIGFRLLVSATTAAQLPPPGGQAALRAQMFIRDEQPVLFGFADESERRLFGLLLGVQAVGPKLALSVLSGGTPGELAGAIAAGDHRRFQAVQGVGKRTAERIIVELREQVGAPAAADEIVVARGGDARLDAREGLVGLGFSLPEAEALLREAAGETAEELVADALKAAKP